MPQVGADYSHKYQSLATEEGGQPHGRHLGRKIKNVTKRGLAGAGAVLYPAAHVTGWFGMMLATLPIGLSVFVTGGITFGAAKAFVEFTDEEAKTFGKDMNDTTRYLWSKAMGR